MQMQVRDSIGPRFVWTKFGVEAGQPIADIVARKEIERRANGGIFLWGIGNNVGHAINMLAQLQAPEVIFSPIASAPRPCDQSSESVVAWTEAENIDGEPFSIPDGSVVTSRGGIRKNCHFALVCYSQDPLCLDNSNEQLYAGSLRNLVSGRQVGSSQVTSVVSTQYSQTGRTYTVAMKLRLVAPYFVRLRTPVAVSQRVHRRLNNALVRESAMVELRSSISRRSLTPKLKTSCLV